MRKRSKLIFAALAAAITLAALVSTTSANRFAMSSQTFRATWSNIRFIGFVTMECHLTIEGSFHSRTVSKIAEALSGYITRSIVDEGHCTGGSARMLSELLPWHIRYKGFTGTLPRITSVSFRIVGSSFLVSALNTTCLFSSSAASPITDIVNINTTTGVAESISDEEASIPRTSGSELLCANSTRLTGTTSSLTVPGTATKITVTLVQ